MPSLPLVLPPQLPDLTDMPAWVAPMMLQPAADLRDGTGRRCEHFEPDAQRMRGSSVAVATSWSPGAVTCLGCAPEEFTRSGDATCARCGQGDDVRAVPVRIGTAMPTLLFFVASCGVCIREPLEKS